MKEYDLIVIGTGTAMSVADAMIQVDPKINIAVIDKDEPGGICLTRGCIPTKILVYPAELVRTIESAKNFGINVEINDINFAYVMERMRTLIYRDINGIRHGLMNSPNIDYYRYVGEFIKPFTMRVGTETITAKKIIVCSGSKPLIPPIKGLGDIGYLTSDTVLKLQKPPTNLVILGGGYIAAEYGHFFSAMGSRVTIVGRNPQFLPQEEPEISALAKREMSKYIKILTNHEVVEVKKSFRGRLKVIARDRHTRKKIAISAGDILVATGRASNSDITHPEKSGIKMDDNGWIKVNEYLETSQPNIWALGDANGQYLFKHVANHEARILLYNVVLKKKVKVDYHAVPHAVFTHPEIASVGMKEKEAIQEFGESRILIGFQRYEDTAKGEAMGVKDFFVKVVVEKEEEKLLGAHIIGPQASVLIHEVINLMYTKDQSIVPIRDGMHIHPALSEVVERAFGSLIPARHYHHILEEHYKLPVK
ncbi:dihydrolipoyl dehydrogenase [[Eubacterium] cellulosolvens]